MKIENAMQVMVALENGAYAWPGGYPLYFVAADGGALSFEAVDENMSEVIAAFEDGGDPAWKPVAVEVNWEDIDLHCDHTGAKIESAYGED